MGDRGTGTGTVPAGTIERIEKWFVSRGVPHFIDNYSATQDVFTRSLPVITLIFVFEMLGAINLDWPVGANVLVLPAGFGVLIVAWALVNRLRARRTFQRPDDLGAAELATFVLAPALLPVLSAGRSSPPR